MKIKFLTVLIFVFHASVILHIFFIYNYISTKVSRDFWGLIITTFTNVGIAMSIIFMVMDDPQLVPSLNWEKISYYSSGILFFSMGAMKVRIVIKLIGKTLDPVNYHYSYFGKKVYDTAIVTIREVAVYFFTVPIWLLAGAYFMVMFCSKN